MAAPRRQLAAAIATGIAASTAAVAAVAAAFPGWPAVPPSLQPCAFAAFHGFFGLLLAFEWVLLHHFGQPLSLHIAA